MLRRDLFRNPRSSEEEEEEIEIPKSWSRPEIRPLARICGWVPVRVRERRESIGWGNRACMRACVRACVRACEILRCFFFGLSPKSQVLPGFASHTTTWLVQIGPQIKAKVQLRCVILGAGSSLVVISNHLFFFLFLAQNAKTKRKYSVAFFFKIFFKNCFCQNFEKGFATFLLGF